jgi:D-amino peptidase
MKILIAADMEGISGVVHWDHVDHKHTEYQRFRKLMTSDINAAIRGAYDAGAQEMIVADGHGTFRNILVEEIDPRARLNSGAPRLMAMVQGLDATVHGVMFIGYHARVGTPSAILDHTWSSRCVAGVWINGQAVGEIGVNAGVCGHFGVPVIMISGDQAACAEAVELLGPIETAVVKQATGRMSADCLPPIVAQQRIYEAARQAIQRLETGDVPQPLSLETPAAVSVELVTSDMADRATVLPGAHRLEGKRVTYTADDMLSAYRAMRAIAALANG